MCRLCLALTLAAAGYGTAAARGDSDVRTPSASVQTVPYSGPLQAPELAAQVASGDLPPLRERIPNEPFVVTPLHEPGVYGGVARTFEMDLNILVNTEKPLSIAADVATLIPSLARDWRWNAAQTELTIELRKGLRWSDGQPMTSEDFRFFFEDMMHNAEFTPVLGKPWNKTRLIVIDEQSFRYEFAEPNPLIENIFAQLGEVFFAPAHFLRDYHPDYAGRVEVDRRVAELGYLSWNSLVDSLARGRNVVPPYAPTMKSHYIVKRTPTRIVAERNPYYHKVDSLGRQLPYIDRVEADVVESAQTMTARAATGQVDFAGYALNTQDFPLFKLGERTSGIRALVWNRLHGSDIIIRPNYNVDNPRLRELYWQFDFRRALSIALNREEMNQIIYFGRGTPRQPTVVPTSAYFEPEFASAHTEYDPDEARALLDGLGLKDRDGDGLREYSDGEPLTITVEYVEVETPREITLELATTYWREVGLDLRMKPLDRGLQTARSTAGLMEMSVWHADRSTDLLFPAQPVWHAPIHVNWEGPQWNDWVRWYQTDGRLGERPPPPIAQLHSWWDEMRRTTVRERRLELGRNLLRSTAENLWSIGTVGLAPQPIVVSRRLRNVPDNGLWGWDTRWTMPYQPSSWYFATVGD